MKYRVAFEKRSRRDGAQSALDPTRQLDTELPDGVVADKAVVEWMESDAQHSQEELDEDDAFLGLASAEVWEYEIFDGRSEEFEEAIARSGVVMEYTVLDESPTGIEEAQTVPLDEANPIESGTGDATESDAPVVTDATPEIEGADATEDAESAALGLTKPGPDTDWAADTGPTRNPGRDAKTRDLSDRSSTLRP